MIIIWWFSIILLSYKLYYCLCICICICVCICICICICTCNCKWTNLLIWHCICICIFVLYIAILSYHHGLVQWWIGDPSMEQGFLQSPQSVAFVPDSLPLIHFHSDANTDNAEDIDNDEDKDRQWHWQNQSPQSVASVPYPPTSPLIHFHVEFGTPSTFVLDIIILHIWIRPNIIIIHISISNLHTASPYSPTLIFFHVELGHFDESKYHPSSTVANQSATYAPHPNWALDILSFWCQHRQWQRGHALYL